MATNTKKNTSVPKKKDEEKQQTPLTSQPAEVKVDIPKPGEAKTSTAAAQTPAPAPAEPATKTEAKPATTEAAAASNPDPQSIAGQIAALQKQSEAATAAAADRVRTAGEKAYLAYTDETNRALRRMEDADKAADEAGKTYVDMVQGWIDARKEEEEAQRKRIEAQEKRDEKIRTWGGITEAAAALVNLMGTAHGAANQKWESPQNKWTERADALRRERDKKLEDLRSQMKTLEAQKAQLEYSLGVDKANRDTKRETILSQRADTAAKLQSDTAASVAQIKNQGATQRTNLGMQGLQLSISEQNKLAELALRAQDDSLQWANYNLNKDQKEFLQRSQGYNPETKKWLNPQTGKYDLDAPAVQKTAAFNAEDVDGSIRSLAQTNPEVMDELAKAMNFGSYSDYVNAKSKDKEKGQKKYNSAYQLIRKFQDTEGTFKFSSTDLALLKEYAPDFYAQLMGTGTSNATASASSSSGYEVDEDGFPIKRNSVSETTLTGTAVGDDASYNTYYYDKYKASHKPEDKK